jgi:excinuclease ABC subunit A
MISQEDIARSAPDPSAAACIRVRGARVHNLKNVDLDIPRNRLVVLTGPSGSGKSSLAFDTLYAEGQRQYLESLSVHARQFLHQMERPDVDMIDGLPPTICIDQRPAGVNPRSTVATVTEIYDYLRLLMARLGEPYCYRCQEPIQQQSSEQIEETLLALAEGTKLMVLAPLVRGRRGCHDDAFAQIRKAGFVRARVDGRVYDLEALPELSERAIHHIEAVVDRVVIRPGVEGRLAESIRLALRYGEGRIAACYLAPNGTAEEHGNGKGAWRDQFFSTLYACPGCGLSYEELEPRTFSFNSPYGACPRCEGFGRLEQFDPELVIPDRALSLAAGAIAPWKGSRGSESKRRQAELASFLAAHDAAWETPLRDLPAATFQQLLHGDGREFLGVLTTLEKEYVTTTDDDHQERLAGFRGQVACPACGGSRLRPEATSVRVTDKNIHDLCRLPVSEATRFFDTLVFPADQQPVAEPLLREIGRRLRFLEQVGVDYLTLERPADTLSGGELQRVRLATGIGCGLVGVCYVLDEPSIGLHSRDNERLIAAVRDLQQQGNTVLVVEHDEAMMRVADRLIDIGPGAGAAGGVIVAQGAPEQVAGDPQSLTGRYLSGVLQITVPTQRRRTTKTHALTLEGVSTHNLQAIDVRFPLGVFVCVTGVSGSGKSSLVNETLAPALIRRLGGVAPRPGPFRSLRGANQIDKVILVDQSPIGRTPRSTPATYLGVFDEIRNVFAQTREAKQRGYHANRFSFNAKGGRCEECQGHGVKKIEMNFLPDLYVTCNVCDGTRFNRQTLEVRYRGSSIADVMTLSVDTATAFFESFPTIHRLLLGLQDVGLGYLALGQPSNTLSGGEAQRIKLAAELTRVDTGQTLYLLDEPTTGLHFDDIRRLLGVLGRLVDRGNTVIVIEHNLDVIKCADWIIDLGPGGGQAGGQLVAVGPPEVITACAASHTGQFLRRVLP